MGSNPQTRAHKTRGSGLMLILGGVGKLPLAGDLQCFLAWSLVFRVWKGGDTSLAGLGLSDLWRDPQGLGKEGLWIALMWSPRL